MWMKVRDESERRGVERSLKLEAPEDKSHWRNTSLNSKDYNQSMTTRGTFLKGVLTSEIGIQPVKGNC